MRLHKRDTSRKSVIGVHESGATSTSTLTPDAGVENTSNVITVAPSYTDLADNTGSGATSDPYAIDTTPPTAGTLSFANLEDTGSSDATPVTQDGTFDLTLSCDSDANGVSVAYEVSTDGGLIWAPTTASQTSLADGDYQFRAVVTDPAGNSAISNTTEVVVDTTPPTAGLIIGPITDDNMINAAEAGGPVAVSGLVGGEVHPGDLVTLTVHGTNYSGAVLPDLSFNIAVAGSDLAADSTVLGSVTTTDAAGNSTTATADRAYTVLELTPNDFNSDGKSDILWRNDNGDAYLWNSNAGSSTTFAGLDLGVISTDWHIMPSH